MDYAGLLELLIPELAQSRGVVQPKEHYWDVFEHSLRTVDAMEYLLNERTRREDEPEFSLDWLSGLNEYFTQEIAAGHSRRAMLKLACLLHDIGKPGTKTFDEKGKMRFLGHAVEGAEMAELLMKRFRFSNREIKTVKLMIENHLRPGYLVSDEMPSSRAIYRFFRDTENTGLDTLILGLADHLAARGPSLDQEQWNQHIETTRYMLSKWYEGHTKAKPAKLLDGHIIIKRFGIPPGPRLGEVLEMVREAQASGEVTTEAEAMQLVERALENTERES
jgi:poly(A) polymerase